MFQFPGFASHTYVFSVRYLLRGGFPHSDILGSKLVCQLPEAYRRLPRLSSPVAAKASTVCAYSLDHITSKRRDHMFTAWFSVPMQHSQTRCFKNTPNQSESASHIKKTWLLFWRLYIHHCPNCKRTICLCYIKRQKAADESSSADFWLRSWWSQPGSNRRPLACKASALPAELWPPRLPFLPMTSLRVSLRCSCTHKYTPLLASPAPRPRQKIRRESGHPPCLAHYILR
jgi:hypothetical protein